MRGKLEKPRPSLWIMTDVGLGTPSRDGMWDGVWLAESLTGDPDGPLSPLVPEKPMTPLSPLGPSGPIGPAGPYSPGFPLGP